MDLKVFFRTVWWVLRKDLTVELRTREVFLTTLFFAVATVLVFAFGFVRDGRPPEGAAAGILWIATAFSGTLALGRTFERERVHATLETLLLIPGERAAVYVGKALGLVGLMLLVEVVLLPLVGLLFQADVIAHLPMLVVLLLAGTTGFAAVGTLFAAMLSRSRTRDVLLPILLYPITVPVLIAGVRGTAALLEGSDGEAWARAWVAMLVFFDVVFVTLALWTFEAVMTDS